MCRRIIILLNLLLCWSGFAQQSILLDTTNPPAVANDAEPSPPKETSQANSTEASSSAPKPELKQKKNAPAKPARISQVKISNSPMGQQLVVTMSAQAAEPKVQALASPNRFVMDIPNAKLAKGVKREFSSTLGQIRVGAHDNEVRLVVDFGNSDIPKYQISNDANQISVTFEQRVVQPEAPKSEIEKESLASEDEILKKEENRDIPDLAFRDRQTISIEFRDADIRNVLHFIGDASGFNIVVSEKVKGRISAHLNGVPWYEAVDSVLRVKNLTYTQSEGVIKVITFDELEKNRGAENSNGRYPNSDGEIITRIIPVNYGLAKDLSVQVKDMLSSRGKVTVDERTNVLIVSDILVALNRASNLIKSLDTQTPQILIEARMVEAELNFSRSLGVQWGGRIGNVNAGQPVAGTNQNYVINMPALNPTTSAGVQLGTAGNWAVINARLSAAEQHRRVKTISMPKIMTLDNKSARITQGYQIPVSFSNASIVSTQFVYAALQLDVTPHVSSDGSIMLSIKMTNNEPDFLRKDNLGVPAIKTKEAMTELLVKDGDTAVIGGIYTRDQNNGIDQTPVLGSIPILGWIFKSTEVIDRQKEMMVFLTPRLVNRQKATLDTQIVDKAPDTSQP